MVAFLVPELTPWHDWEADLYCYEVQVFEDWLALEVLTQPDPQPDEDYRDRVKCVTQLHMCAFEQRASGAYPGGPMAWALEPTSRPMHELTRGW